MNTLKIRVPLCDVQGSQGFITLEWLKDLQAVLKETAAGVTSTSAGTSTAAATVASNIASLQVMANALATNQTALEARIRKLEIGYQA